MCQGRGRKEKLTEVDERHLKILSAIDKKQTTADFQAAINASRSEYEVSRMTINWRLNKYSLKGRNYWALQTAFQIYPQAQTLD